MSDKAAFDTLNTFIYSSFGGMDTGGGMIRIPRLKFNFKLTLNYKEGSVAKSRDILRIKSISLPEISYETAIANQYNIKRVIQKKINYGTCSISFYDTYDNESMNFMKNYAKNYHNSGYGLSNESDISAKNKSVIVDSFQTNMGYTLVDNVNRDRYFFEEVNITQFSKIDVPDRLIKLINPIITSFNMDILDYSDSQPVLYTVVFQPEYVIIKDLASG